MLMKGYRDAQRIALSFSRCAGMQKTRNSMRWSYTNLIASLVIELMHWQSNPCCARTMASKYFRLVNHRKTAMDQLVHLLKASWNVLPTGIAATLQQKPSKVSGNV